MGYSLGIDVGTTFTAAAIWRDAGVEVVALETHRFTVPTVVHVDGDDVAFGTAALGRTMSNPVGGAREFKRRLGDPVSLVLSGVPHSADRLVAMFVRWVLESVTEQYGEAPDRVALTHPANWTEFQLHLLTTALEEAGLENVELLSEPQAAAHDFGMATSMRAGELIVVYDLGGGTFDVAMLRCEAGGYVPVGEAAGVERLGGIDFDEAVFQFVLRHVPAEVIAASRTDAVGRMALTRLRRSCAEAKEALSSESAVDVPVMLPGHTSSVRLTRAEFERMVRPMLSQTIELVRRVLERTDVGTAGVSAILLVGGSSRIPLVSELVGSEIGVTVRVDAHPKLVVARGAARWAGTGPATVTPGLGVRRRRRRLLAAAGVVGIAAAAIGGGLLLSSGGGNDGDTQGGGSSDPAAVSESSTTGAEHPATTKIESTAAGATLTTADPAETETESTAAGSTLTTAEPATTEIESTVAGATLTTADPATTEAESTTAGSTAATADPATTETESTLSESTQATAGSTPASTEPQSPTSTEPISPSSSCAVTTRPTASEVTEPPANGATFTGARLVGSVSFPAIESTRPFGGVSGIAFDQESSVLIAVSDNDTAVALSLEPYNDSLLYDLRMDLGNEDELGDEEFGLCATISLLGEDGNPYDGQWAEGVAVGADGSLFVAVPTTPSLRVFHPDGAFDQEINLSRYEPPQDTFVSLTLVDGDTPQLIGSFENALPADINDDAPTDQELVRFFVIELTNYEIVEEYRYPLGNEEHSELRGVLDIAAVDDGRTVIVAEFARDGDGQFHAVLYEIDLDSTTSSEPGEAPPPILQKHEIVDLTDLGITQFNFQGITSGPKLADGTRTVILVSDNDFGARSGDAPTTFVVLALEAGTPDGPPATAPASTDLTPPTIASPSPNENEVTTIATTAPPPPSVTTPSTPTPTTATTEVPPPVTTEVVEETEASDTTEG